MWPDRSLWSSRSFFLVNLRMQIKLHTMSICVHQHATAHGTMLSLWPQGDIMDFLKVKLNAEERVKEMVGWSRCPGDSWKKLQQKVKLQTQEAPKIYRSLPRCIHLKSEVYGRLSKQQYAPYLSVHKLDLVVHAYQPWNFEGTKL